jgi:hypothetical protein
MLYSKASKFAMSAVAAHSARAATSWTFDFTNAALAWTAPGTGVYDITAYVAQGGTGGAGGLAGC